VILARDVPGGLEVLLLQRHPKSRFSPGAFAFPGRRVEASDARPGIEARCRGLGRAEAARQLRDVELAARSLGFWVAALREAFEEAGILLAYRADGRLVDPVTLEAVRVHRARCRDDSAVFGHLLEDFNPSAVIERNRGYAAADGSSKMPSYGQSLTIQETVDLVAYLRQLRSPAAAAPTPPGPGGHATP
jgi:8-oxo-dGTP pyrophosphatase MutT (NUDIX family)